MIDSPRFELLVARHGRALVIALLAVGLLAVVAAGWVVATPSTTTTTEEVDRETVATDVTTSATVVEDGLWEEGTVLENSSVYMLEETPELTLEVVTTVPDGGSEVVHDVELVYRAEHQGETFWEEAESIERASPSVEDGEATTTATIDVEAVDEEYAALEEDFADVGTVEAAVVVTTEYDTGTYEDALVGESTLELGESSYWLADAGSLSTDREHSRSTTVEMTESPNMALVGLFAVVAVLSVGLAAFVASRSDVDEEAARLAVHKQRYADWISNGSLPMWMGDHHVALDTLEDVVDVAIDTNERVVHDDQRGLFAVVNGDVVYYYSDRGLWEETAWPDMSFPTQDATGGSVENVPPIGEAGTDANSDGADAGGDDPSTEDVTELEWSEGDDSDDPDFSNDEDVWRQL